MNKPCLLILSTLLSVSISHAADVTASVYGTGADKQPLGQVVFSDTPFGLLVSPNLTHLPAGLHGFHLHEHPNCDDKGMEAGGHFDPEKTGTHLGPYAKGHLGDLPVLYVGADGTANTPTLAPRLKTSDLKRLTVMVHAGGDTYSDTPELGGGGDRIACGVINP